MVGRVAGCSEVGCYGNRLCCVLHSDDLLITVTLIVQEINFTDYRCVLFLHLEQSAENIKNRNGHRPLVPQILSQGRLEDVVDVDVDGRCRACRC